MRYNRARVKRAPSEMVTTLTAQMSDLLAPISKSTTRMLSTCTNESVRGYLVVVKSYGNKSAVKLGSRRNFRTDHAAFQTLSRAQAIRGESSQNLNFFYISTRWRREWDSNPRYGFPHTRFPSVRLKPLGHLSGWPVLKGPGDFCKGLRRRPVIFPQLTE